MNVAPVIIDIVKSRDLRDRGHAQAQVHEIFDTIGRVVPPRLDLWATVGDEFQVVYPDLTAAVTATTLARLLLDVDCRFGIGYGETSRIDQAATGPIEAGSGWFRAREAIDHAATRQSHGQPWLRTWTVVGSPEGPASTLLHAYLMSRDHIISRMKSKERRISAAWLMGMTQTEIAQTEKMSQPGVSSSLNTSGGRALIYGLESLQETTWW